MEMTYDFLRLAIQRCFEKRGKPDTSYRNVNAATLAHEGIVLIEHFLSEAECERYHAAVMALITSRSNGPEGKEMINGAMLVDRGRRFKSDFNMIDVFDIDQAIPELSTLRDSTFITDIIAECSGRDLCAENLNAYFNKGVRPRVLHVDNFTSPQYKAFIYLTDVKTPEDGPYMYVKGSHLCTQKKILSYLDNFENNRYATDMREYSYDDAMPCIAGRGTLIISDQNGVHGAHPQPDYRERLLLMMNFSQTKIVPR